MAWFQVTFMVEVQDEATFQKDFDEDRIAAALPGVAYLASFEETPSVTDLVRKTWRRLRRPH